MFTGIITNIGIVKKKTEASLLISADASLLQKISNGMSVSVNGICLTVTSFTPNSFTIDYMAETKARTTIAFLKEGDSLNLEMPATPESFLAGHIVQGHVDCKGLIDKITENGNSKEIRIAVPDEYEKYIVDKGSIAVNGISLTVMKANKDNFSIGIIPHTWENTMLHTISEGDYVNIEVDILAKYIEKVTLH